MKNELKGLNAEAERVVGETPEQTVVKIPRREAQAKFTMHLPKRLHTFVKKKCATNEIYMKEYFEKLIEYDQKNNVI